jgi:hypothetical protein
MRVKAPFTAPVLLGVRVISLALRPAISWLKDRVRAVVVRLVPPLAVKPANWTETSKSAGLDGSGQAEKTKNAAVSRARTGKVFLQ